MQLHGAFSSLRYGLQGVVRLACSLRHVRLNRMTKLGRRSLACTAGLAALFVWGSIPTKGNPPVRSVLEMRRERVMIQKWDLSCGAAALGILLRYQFGEPVTEKEIARVLMSRSEYVGHPELVQQREGFSLLDLKRFVQAYHARRVIAKLPRGKQPIRPQLASLQPARLGIASHNAKRSTT